MNTPPEDENPSAKSDGKEPVPSPEPSDDQPTEALDPKWFQQQVPQQFGRYRVVRLLGKGGFGAVYSAVDEQLDRQVAIKVTSAHRLGSRARDQFLTEARIVAALDHPHIVPVLDVGESPDGDLFVVSKLIDGSDLARRIKSNRPDPTLAVTIIESIAEALHYAHGKGLVHRDVKPANILLDRSDRAYLSDFGLALRETDRRREGELAGTPAYMSPEQAQGEGHRVDNRSDIYSLGVVFYELLTGRRPFRAENNQDLITLIGSEDVRTPRIFDPGISKDLERICLKALARRAADRFQVASDFVEEIRWLRSSLGFPGEAASVPGATSNDSSTPDPPTPTPVTPASTVPQAGAANDTEKTPVKVIPRGLRSFDASDADFFLELLPGPFDREGLPQSLRFWKRWIEDLSDDTARPVGLIYGPSGCGKSSLMKAGLLPRLSPQTQVAYVEASQDATEASLLRAVRRVVPDAEGENLSDILSTIRRQRLVPSGGKLLLVIDQFEQWLYSESDYAKAALTSALRQCDGLTVQAIVMVRDDFWLSVSRFLREIGVRLIEGETSALVDLFELDHAEKVLGLFGAAYGKLPEAEADWTPEQQEFVREAVSGLAEDGKVISVRLAIFAEMLRTRPWTKQSLRDVGGVSGVGVTFLEETFAAKHAPPEHRYHFEAIKELLAALLPAIGTNIKGHSQTLDELREAVGYQKRERDFRELIDLLDRKLRFITPVDEASIAQDDASSEKHEAALRYQLTHDFLVPSIREWLARKQRETKEGRALLRLQERTSAWTSKPENRNLPSLWEWITIWRLTDRQKWKPNEKTVIRRAGRVHATRAGLMASAIAILAMLGIAIRGQVVAQQELARVEGLVAQLVTAEPAQLPDIVRQLDQVPELAEPLVSSLLQLDPTSTDDRRSKLHAQLSTVGRDPALIDPLVEELLDNKVVYIGPIVELLQPHSAGVKDKLTGLLRAPNIETNRRFRAGVALAGFVKPENAWEREDLELIATQLVSANAEYQPVLRQNLRPIAEQLLAPIKVVFQDTAASDAMRLGAANAVADFAANDAELLTRLLADATPEQYEVLYPLVEAARPAEGIAELSRIAATMPPDDLGSIPRIAYGQRRANAAVSLLRLGEREKVLPVFDYTDDPEALTQFIFRCRPRGIGAEPLLEVLDILTRRVSEEPLTDITSPAFQQNARARYAVLLALGEFTIDELPADRRDSLISRLADWYANDPSSGVHGACGWLLRHWGQNEIVTQVDQTRFDYSSDREWFTLAITVRPTPPPQPKPENDEESDASEAKTEERDTEKSDSENPENEPQASEPAPEPLPPKTFYYTFIVHPSGEYTIGSVEDEDGGIKGIEVRHTVTLTRPFAMLDREITFEELIAFSPGYAGFMQQFDATPNDAGFGAHWYDSVAFCRWLGEEMGLAETDQCYADPETLDKEQYPRDPQETSFPRDWPLDLSKRGFRLPTESEWEVMSRSGSRTAYGYGSEVALLERFGWFTENSGKKVHPVRKKCPSVRGLFDLHGNLFEWTHDWNGAFGESGVTDPLGASTGSYRVLRGGSWGHVAANCRTAYRSNDTPTNRNADFGFRLALVPSGLAGLGPAEPVAGDATGAEGDRRREE